jgi:hypothetical protein
MKHGKNDNEQTKLEAQLLFLQHLRDENVALNKLIRQLEERRALQAGVKSPVDQDQGSR